MVFRGGNLYVAWENCNVIAQGECSGVVSRYNGTTGAFIDFFVPAGSGGLTEAQGMAFGPDGHLYVGSGDTGEVFRYNGKTGTFMNIFVTSGSGGLSEPKGLLFVADLHPPTIPTLSEWGIIMLSLMLLGAGWARLRRKG